ncbi:unnamed protein product [Bathycoccus prasinos]
MASSAPRPTVQRNVFLPTCDDGENDTALRLECDVYRPPEALLLKTRTIRQRKDVFLLLHAHGKLGGSRFMLNSYAILLAMRGFITYNISFRGCDGNEKTSRASVFGEVDARDVLEMVKEIRTRESVDVEEEVEVKIHVFGYSFGAAVGALAVGLLHEKLLSQKNIDVCSESEERCVWSRCGIDGLILVAFPLGSLNPFATTSSLMGVVSRFLFGKHAGRLRKCFVKDKKNRGSLVARKTRLLFVHGQRDEFTRVKEVRRFCEKLAKGQPEEEDVNDDEDDEENNDEEECNENEFNEKQNNNILSDFFFGVEDDDDSDDDDGSEKPVESSYETFGNTNGTSNAPHLALLEIKGKKSDHFGFVKVKKQRDLLVKRITKFVLAQ